MELYKLRRKNNVKQSHRAKTAILQNLHLSRSKGLSIRTYRTRRMIHDAVMAVVLNICSIFILNFISKIITLARVGGEYSTLCVCVCVLPQNCCLNSIITKSKQVAALKLGNLRQTVALYKTG